jgi:hypothetical protein
MSSEAANSEILSPVKVSVASSDLTFGNSNRKDSVDIRGTFIRDLRDLIITCPSSTVKVTSEPSSLLRMPLSRELRMAPLNSVSYGTEIAMTSLNAITCFPVNQ